MKNVLRACALVLYVGSLMACPYTIENDGTEGPILVVDPNGNHAACIAPGEKATVDVSLRGNWMQKWLTKEKLDFYFPSAKSGALVRQLTMTEHFCSDEGNELKLSEVIGFEKNPTKRFSVERHSVE